MQRCSDNCILIDRDTAHTCIYTTYIYTYMVYSKFELKNGILNLAQQRLPAPILFSFFLHIAPVTFYLHSSQLLICCGCSCCCTTLCSLLLIFVPHRITRCACILQNFLLRPLLHFHLFRCWRQRRCLHLLAALLEWK